MKTKPDSPPPAETLREAIDSERELQGISQSELAARIGCSREHLSRYFAHRCDITTELASRLLAVLGLCVLRKRPTTTRKGSP